MVRLPEAGEGPAAQLPQRQRVSLQNSLMQHFLDVSYRSQEHVLVARWMQQMRTDADFEAGYRYLLKMAQQHNCRFWLLDVRRCSPNCVQQARWLLHEFCPLVETVFGTMAPIFGAHLVFPSHLPHYQEVVLPILSQPANSSYQVAAFIDEGPTTTWLHGQQPAEVPLSSPHLTFPDHESIYRTPSGAKPYGRVE